KGRFSFSSEVETNRVRVEKEETVPITNHILLSKNLTSEEPTSVPIVIDKAETIMLLRIMAQDDFVAGEISSSEIYIEEIAKEYGWQNTMRWLNSIYLDNYSKPAILIGIMHCLSHFEFDNVKPEGQTMALGLLQHEDVFVRDLAIRAYENWNDKEALPILKSLSYDTKWLRDYVDAVVKALEQ
ncbi:MAG: hypothetical protein LBJ61_05580, partial [Deltaproteobacteria bacterium]|nr:hypothetical protein [Deltaproteobacteria bacterium]